MVFLAVTTAMIFLLAGLVFTLLYFYQKRQLAYQHSLESLKLDYDKNLLRTRVEIHEQTILSISREIHDNISLSLTLVKLNLNTLDWFDPENASRAVKSSIAIIGSAIQQLNNLSKSMNTELIKNLGLLKALKNEVEKLREMARLQVSFETAGEPIFLDSEKELVIFRIIQEAFNNIVKHAQATKVWLQLDYGSENLNILVRDNGIGYSKEKLSQGENYVGSGLINMQTRAKLFGGKMLIEGIQKKGTQILVTIPY